VFGELQAGSFLFMDADYAGNERDPAQPQFEQSLFVKSQVISCSLQHVVCDAGHKSHALDSGMPLVLPIGPDGELDYFNGGDEHGILRPGPGGTSCRRWATRSGWCPATATPPSTCTTTWSAWRAAWPTARSNASSGLMPEGR
jgi:hypothetical protein